MPSITPNSSGYFSTLTESQTLALNHLKSRLTKELYNEAGLTEPEDLIIWRIDLSNFGNPSLEIGQHRVLLKFLRAKEFNVEAACTMLIDCLKWRKSFLVHSILTESFPDAMKEFGEVYGRTELGHPVTYSAYGPLTPSRMEEIGMSTFLRWRVQLMERALARLDLQAESSVEEVLQVHDYAGATMRPRGTLQTLARTLIQWFQAYYPECLYQKLFVNVPRWLASLYPWISVFVSARTRAKFHMQSAARPCLLLHVSLANLPPRLGGPSSAPPHPIAWQTQTIPAHTDTLTFFPVPAASPGVWTTFLLVLSLDLRCSVGWHPTAVEGKEEVDALKRSHPPLLGDRFEKELRVDQPGHLFFVLDNTYSRFTSKTVMYGAWKKE